MRLKRPKFSFNVSKRVFDVYMEDYNKDKKSKDKLKAAHSEIFYELLLHFAKRVKILREMKFAPPIDSNALPHVLTNNIILGDRRKRSATTIWRLCNRLIDAGVLKKTGHGSLKNIEFEINPMFLAIYDGDNAKFNPKLYRTEFKHVETAKIAVCKLLYVSFMETINKKEMHGNCLIVEKAVPILNESNNWKPLYGNTPKHTDKAFTGGRENRGRREEYARQLRAIKAKTEAYKLKWASYIVDLYISLMLIGKKIYMGERWRAVEYVKQKYFDTSNDVKIRTLGHEYKNRLKMAHGYAQTKGQNYQAPFPSRYFDNQNVKNGFIRTKTWLNNKIKYEGIKELKKKIKAKKQMDDQQVLQTIMKDYNASPTMDNYVKHHRYIEKNMPHLTKEFLMQITVMKG